MTRIRARPGRTMDSIRAAAGALAVLLVAASPGRAAEGRIDGVTARVDGRDVTVAAHLAGGFPPEIADQIQNGVPKDLFYTVALNRHHRNWFDEEMSGATVQFTIKYDTLAGRYLIRRLGPEGAVTRSEAAGYDEAVAAVSSIRGVRLTLPKDHADSSHYVAVKAEMRAVEMPLYLDYVFFFIPRLEYETPWARSRNLENLP